MFRSVGRAPGPRTSPSIDRHPGGLLRGGTQTETCSQAAIMGGALLNAVPQAWARNCGRNVGPSSLQVISLVRLWARGMVLEPQEHSSWPGGKGPFSFFLLVWDYLKARGSGRWSWGPGQAFGHPQGPTAQTLPLGGGRWGWTKFSLEFQGLL